MLSPDLLQPLKKKKKKKKTQDAEPDVVLVPPIFERDFRGRSRMAKSGYHYQFGRPALKWLFHDYLQGNDGGWSRVDLRPAEDPRVVTRLKVAAGAPGGFVPAVAATLRFQPSDFNPLSFFDIKAGSGGGGGGGAAAGDVFAGGRSSASLLPKLFPSSADDEACAKVRACYFDPSKRFGAFGAVVLASGGGGGGAGGASSAAAAAAASTSALRHAAVGARYSSEQASLGVILDPASGGALRTAWAVARAGAMTAGVSLSPPPSNKASAASSASSASPAAIAEALSSSVAAALATPGSHSPGGPFAKEAPRVMQRALLQLDSPEDFEKVVLGLRAAEEVSATRRATRAALERRRVEGLRARRRRDEARAESMRALSAILGMRVTRSLEGEGELEVPPVRPLVLECAR